MKHTIFLLMALLVTLTGCGKDSPHVDTYMYTAKETIPIKMQIETNGSNVYAIMTSYETKKDKNELMKLKPYIGEFEGKKLEDTFVLHSKSKLADFFAESFAGKVKGKELAMNFNGEKLLFKQMSSKDSTKLFDEEMSKINKQVKKENQQQKKQAVKIKKENSSFWEKSSFWNHE